jgi:hypothetical protein
LLFGDIGLLADGLVAMIVFVKIWRAFIVGVMGKGSINCLPDIEVNWRIMNCHMLISNFYAHNLKKPNARA